MEWTYSELFILKISNLLTFMVEKYLGSASCLKSDEQNDCYRAAAAPQTLNSKVKY